MVRYYVRKNTIGQPFDFEFVDASEITSFKFYLLRPDGTEVERTQGTRVTKAHSTALRYSSVQGDLPIASERKMYKLQLYIETSSGYKGRREVINFFVYNDFKNV